MERDAVIVAGFGFRAGATAASLAAALDAAWGDGAVDRLAVPEAKAGAAALDAFAARRGLAVVAVPEAMLRTVATPTPAPRGVRGRYGTSPAEAAALVAAGPGARLAARRAVSSDRLATCAVAIGGS
ncbi:MAG: cobalamin biosynthesis protein [Paracoccaceae bacterium]